MKKTLTITLGFILLIIFYCVFVIDRVILAPIAKTSVSLKTWYEVPKWVLYSSIRVVVLLLVVLIFS